MRVYSTGELGLLIRKGKPEMISETIAEIEARVKRDKALDEEKRKELLNLLSNLKVEISELSRTHAGEAQPGGGLTGVSVHEDGSEKRNSELLKLSQALSNSVAGLENSHPDLVHIVNSLSLTLSNMGI